MPARCRRISLWRLVLNWPTDCPLLAEAHIHLQETYTVLVPLRRWNQEQSGKWLTDHALASRNILAFGVVQFSSNCMLYKHAWQQGSRCIAAPLRTLSLQPVFVSRQYPRIPREPHMSSNAFDSFLRRYSACSGKKS